MTYETHSFSVELATEIGLEEALVLQHFYWWYQHNIALPSMIIDGRVWCYFSISRAQEVFPYLSVKVVRNTIERLINAGLLIKDHKGEGANKMNRTCWYSLTDSGLGKFHLPKGENALAQTGNIDNNIVNNKSTNVDIISIDKGEAKFDFRKSLIALGVTPSTVDQWLLVRKKKGAVNTEAAFNTIAKEIAKAAPVTPEACIYKAVAESWRGFKADWLHEESPAQRKGNATPAAHSAGAYPRPKHDSHLDVDFSQFYPQA